jgi:hypothetical protein
MSVKGADGGRHLQPVATRRGGGRRPAPPRSLARPAIPAVRARHRAAARLVQPSRSPRFRSSVGRAGSRPPTPRAGSQRPVRARCPLFDHASRREGSRGRSGGSTAPERTFTLADGDPWTKRGQLQPRTEVQILPIAAGRRRGLVTRPPVLRPGLGTDPVKYRVRTKRLVQVDPAVRRPRARMEPTWRALRRPPGRPGRGPDGADLVGTTTTAREARPRPGWSRPGGHYDDRPGGPAAARMEPTWWALRALLARLGGAGPR